ncbi:MAG: hypothetical protein PHI44_05595 [Candidatus Ratteibacteria bacterium]|nr:hypothetical protein [Candidatus Ratteibacteria bacterium]
MAISVYEQVKKALQDIVAPELKSLQIEIKRLDEKIESGYKRLDEKIEGGYKRLDEKIESMKNEMMSEIKRLDEKIDGLERELKVAIEIRERLSALEAKVGIKAGTE